MKSFFGKKYKDSLKFLRGSKRYIFFALIIFLIFFIIGFLFPVFFEDKIIELLTGLKSLFAEKSLFETIFLIFFNNIRAGFFAMILGIGLGVIPLIILIVNGYLLGFVSRGAVGNENIFILWRLLPHGIFELPAFLFSAGVGLKLGMCFLKKNISLKKEIKKSLIFFLLVIIPLFLIAAIVEGIFIWSVN